MSINRNEIKKQKTISVLVEVPNVFEGDLAHARRGFSNFIV